MINMFIYCAGIIVVVVFASWIVELVDNYRNDWPSRVTAEDIEQLKRLFEEDGASVDFNEKGEKFLVGYKKN